MVFYGIHNCQLVFARIILKLYCIFGHVLGTIVATARCEVTPYIGNAIKDPIDLPKFKLDDSSIQKNWRWFATGKVISWKVGLWLKGISFVENKYTTVLEALNLTRLTMPQAETALSVESKLLTWLCFFTTDPFITILDDNTTIYFIIIFSKKKINNKKYCQICLSWSKSDWCIHQRNILFVFYYYVYKKVL